MPVFGIDVSSFQKPLSGMVPAIKRQGFEFLIAKCTEGHTVADDAYAAFHAGAKQAGMLFGAYHFLWPGEAAAQAANYVAHCIDKDVPVMIDLEAHGATLADANAFRLEVKKLGVTRCLLYLPHWYWFGTLHSPSLAGWDGRVVSSAYPSTRFDYASKLYPGPNGVGWDPYGGVKPSIWQFADSVKIDGYAGHVDGDVFDGTSDELRSQLPFKDFNSKPAPKPTPKPQPKPAPKGGHLRLIEWNCYVDNLDATVEATLSGWAEKYDPDAFLLSEARTHARVLHEIDGYTVYQESPGALQKNGIVNDDGDSVILLRNDHVKAVKSHRVARMLKRWKVVDPKHPHTHTPRHYQVLKLKLRGRIVRLRASHWPTHGFAGANHLAVMESAARSKVWLRVGRKAVSVDAGDLNDTLAAIVKFYGKGYAISGAKRDDILVARGVKTVSRTQLDKGGSDTHFGQLFDISF